MRLARPVLSVVVLLSYLLLAVGAEPLHWSQWSAGTHACLDGGCDATVGHRSDRDGHCHDGGCRLGHDGSAKSPASSSVSSADCGTPAGRDAPGDVTVAKSKSRPGHHAADCFVCQILGQAQDRTESGTSELSQAAVAEATPALPHFSPSPVLSPFHSRGPPHA